MRGILRHLVRLAAIAVAFVAVASCSTERSELAYYKRADGKLEVEFWHAMSGKQAQSLNAIIDEFNRSQDKYAVVGIYQGAYNSLSQKLIASTYGGRQPVCTQAYESWTTRFLRYGCLQPADHFIRKDPDFGEEDIADFPKAFVDDNSYRMRLDEEGVYHIDPAGEPTMATMPFNKSTYLLFVNETRMRELGGEPPKTWAEMVALSRLMTKLDSDPPQYGFAARPLIESFTTLLFTTGANYMDDAGEFTFAGEEGLATFELLRELVMGENRSGYVEPAYLNAAFGAGRIGMYIGSTASFPFNDSAVGNKFIWRAYPIPDRDEKTKGRTLSQGTNVAILRKGFSDGSAIPEEVQWGAWEFAKFLTSREVTAKWAAETGYLPVRKSALETEVLAKYVESNANFKTAVGEMERLMFEPKPIWWDTVRTALDREVDAVLNDRKKPAEGLGEALRRAEVTRETAGAG